MMIKQPGPPEPGHHHRTPALTVTDPRGLAVRAVEYRRSSADAQAIEQITRSRHDAAGRLVADTDPRLYSPNQSTVFSLSNQPVLIESVDAGWRLSLADENANAVDCWDGRHSHWRTVFDTLARPVALAEKGREHTEYRVIGRQCYAHFSEYAAAHNQCGRLIRNDDTAGTQLFVDYAVSGAVLSETRHFLSQRELPDWPLPVPVPVLQPVHEPGAQLESGDGATTAWMFNALGEQRCQVDAVGNQQHTLYTLAGEIKSSITQLKEGPPTAVLHSVTYDAMGRIEQQTLGCGVTRSHLYDPMSGRLKKLTSTRPGRTLQALNFQYDPVGNVIQIEDQAQPARHFANQQVSALNTYRYDSLYQLIEATGREALGTSIGPQLPDRTPNPADLSQLLNYRQTYDYDSGGNLIQLHHIGHEPFTRTMHIAPGSNRGVPSTVTPDSDSCFDANGNLQTLQPGQTLEWDLRNQLSRTVQVIRSSGLDDDERYLYDAQGQRLRKITTRHNKAAIDISDVRYLPGLEIHTREGECLHIIVAPGARCLHWETGNPHAPDNDQLRYTLEDHLGSSTLELDKHAAIISHEGYYPFGGTAWWDARSAVEATYKTIRYSGKERDATGLYYYGFRYYAPWLARWINPDPAGDVDGLNQYRMLRNNPMRYIDKNGNVPTEVESAYRHMVDDGQAWETLRARGNAYAAIRTLSGNNLSTLQRNLELSPAQERFVAGFIEESFNLVHFSNNDFRDSDGALTVLSKKQLIKNKKNFSASNTDLLDLQSFATDDFVFFSLEAGAIPQKTKSRFGDHQYRAPMHALLERYEYSHMEITDLGLVDERPGSSKPAWVRPEDKDAFFQSAQSNTYEASLFMGADMIEGLALRMVSDLQDFSSETQDNAFTLQQSGQSNEVMNSLFRPQIVVPHSLALAKNNVSYKGPAITRPAKPSVPVVKHFYV